ncbi:MAG: lipoyl synthase [Fimbriimonadaceae bacterium]|nr:lipoyl synthase [Fimbriimonadaceae bacterium]
MAVTRRPEWLKMPFPAGEHYQDLKTLVADLQLHTVCEAARCPNIGECWNQRTATFMLLGNVCTRACGFCNIATGRPEPVDAGEPERVARAIAYLKLQYAVLTSVNRDDLPDGGAHIFAATLRAIHDRLPDCRVEVLIPDFKGDPDALAAVLAAAPAVLNHNVETVRRLGAVVHPQAKYDRTLELFRRAARLAPEIPLKSGYMVGHGETFDECVELMQDLCAAGVRILTVGQYLRPSQQHLPVERYWTPAEFADLRERGLAIGFDHVEAGALVRSSYHAREQEAAAHGQAPHELGAPRPLRAIPADRSLITLPVLQDEPS